LCLKITKKDKINNEKKSRNLKHPLKKIRVSLFLDIIFFSLFSLNEIGQQENISFSVDKQQKVVPQEKKIVDKPNKRLKLILSQLSKKKIFQRETYRASFNHKFEKLTESFGKFKDHL
jgi:hypothetical protein